MQRLAVSAMCPNLSGVPMGVKQIDVTTGYGHSTKEPFVEIMVPEKRIRMSPENARDLALNLLQAAEAAYSDAFLTEFLVGVIDSTPAEAAVVLAEFRKWREQKQDW